MNEYGRFWGAYDPEAAYLNGDVCVYDGIAYRCDVPSVKGVSPVARTKPYPVWKMLGQEASMVLSLLGNGGGGLPIVTAENNGDILIVAGGKWVPANVPDVEEAVAKLESMEDARVEAVAAAQTANAAAESVEAFKGEIREDTDKISAALNNNNCVDYLPPYPDTGETTKNGITYRCNDNVFTFSGTASATTIVWLYDLEHELPDWWIPGKTVRIVFDKSMSFRKVYFRVYGYVEDDSVPLLLDLTDAGSYEFTIPDRADLIGVQMRYHIPSGTITDTTATVRIISTMTNAELAEIVSDARTALPVTMTDGLYIRGESGAAVSNASLLASEPIDVSAYRGMPISVRSYLNGVIGFAFYSALPCTVDTYVSGVSGNTSGMTEIGSEVIVTVPDNASYLRISGYTGFGQNCRVVTNVTLANVNEQAQQGGKRVLNRKVAMFGDSITWGRDGNGASTDRTENTIPATVAKMLGVSVANYGVSGMGWLPNSTCPNPIYTKLTTVDLTMYDTITICLGVNDGFNPLGAWDSEDETTVMGQVHKCIKYIYAQNPSARLVLIAPFNGRNVGNFPDYWYTDSESESYTSRNRLSDALEKACDYYWIPYIDQRSGPINAYTIQTLIGADGVHPSEEGYQRLGEWIAGELRRLIG